ncbi:MAG TPA: HupE/UreJ family protein [Lacunisphaera sp.]|nr:HupE/UreJ family protein [Lacunisphaera sp.]
MSLPRFFLLHCLLAAAAWAHDAGVSVVDIRLHAGGFTIASGYAPIDAQAMVQRADEPLEAWSVADFNAARARLLELVPRLWAVRVGSELLPALNPRVQEVSADNVTVVADYQLPPQGPRPVELHSVRLPEMLAGHRQYVTATDAAGVLVTRKLLDSTDPVFVFTPGPAVSAASGTLPPGFWGFLKLGVEHIWTGYDHLLFLFGLLLVCRSFRSVVIVITCFTLAHSLTLALATLEVVSLPSRFVEAVIAASIVFVGLENLWRRGGEPKGRWILTFVFGLVHGFGFASVLRDLGVGATGGGLLLPLFTFNLGVELGQVAVAAVVLPLFWQLRKNEQFARIAPPVLSALVALAGLYWLLERVFFSQLPA